MYRTGVSIVSTGYAIAGPGEHRYKNRQTDANADIAPHRDPDSSTKANADAYCIARTGPISGARH